MTLNTEINHKQAELLNRLFEQAKSRFPSIERQELRRSPEDGEHLWLYVLAPLTEDEEVEFMDFCGELETDILLETGYRVSLMPRFPVLQ